MGVQFLSVIVHPFINLFIVSHITQGKHYQRIASELVRCLAFSSSRKLRNDYDGYYDPDVDTEHNATHTAEISAGNTQLVLKLHGLSSDFSDEDENADESTMYVHTKLKYKGV